MQMALAMPILLEMKRNMLYDFQVNVLLWFVVAVDAIYYTLGISVCVMQTNRNLRNINKIPASNHWRGSGDWYSTNEILDRTEPNRIALLLTKKKQNTVLQS